MSQLNKNEILLGITLGDPGGIGAEVTLKALEHFNIPSGVRILLIGDSYALNSLKQKNTLDIRLFKNSEAWFNSNAQLSLLDIQELNSGSIEFGREKPEYGKAAYNYLEKAVELIKNHNLNRLITAPVNKKVINLSGKDFIGHTEFLAERFNIKANKVLMMLLSEDVRFVLLTRHVPVKKVSENINKDSLKEIVDILDKEMKRNFKKKEIKIGILGLNPHLGEKGIIGREEEDIIVPAIAELEKEYNVKGPLSVEKAVEEMKQKKLDVSICMYHDQAIVPLKLLYPNKGINFTLGLPFIRTSPFHGTAYDIAGKDIASYKSMLETLEFTVSI